jgi:hypothetical protein
MICRNLNLQIVCSYRLHRNPDGSKGLVVFVQQRLEASKASFGKCIAVLFTSVINKLTRDEARGIDDARPAPGINTEKRQGFRRQLQGSEGHKESQYLFLSFRNSFHSQKPNLLLAQSTNTTHRHSTSLS